MKVLTQRVEKAALYTKQDTLKFIGNIGEGLLVFIGIEKQDTPEDLHYLADKVVNLRVFEDEQGKLNISVKDKNFEIMCIPNFTLSACARKGRRPSFDNAASKDKARQFFDMFCKKLRESQVRCVGGIFGASMVIEAGNYGPVNIILDSADRK